MCKSSQTRNSHSSLIVAAVGAAAVIAAIPRLAGECDGTKASDPGPVCATSSAPLHGNRR
jgi:hypothetical protein